MNNDVDSQHRKHLPVPYVRRAILPHGVEHEEATEKETHDNRMFGTCELTAVVRLRQLDKHEQKSEDTRTDPHNKLYRRICIDIYAYHP